MERPPSPPRVALETTLLAHGVPRDAAVPLSRDLAAIVRAEGAEPALIGIVGGRAVVGMTEAQLEELLDAPAAGGGAVKVNTANLGLMLHGAAHGATTVSATLELAAAAGIRVFATGGLGGVHRGVAEHLDISADLSALTRFPVAVVSSGVKSLLDIAATREVLETLGVCVVGYRTDHFPAFYLRRTDPPIGVDARFDDADELAEFLAFELARSGRGIVVCNPIPQADEVARGDWERWLAEAMRRATAPGAPAIAGGRAVTPSALAHLHEVSGEATLRANIALVKSNAQLAARLAAAMASRHRTHPGPARPGRSAP
jgi:pseudouridine-5'-phosphate glycosidase